MTSEYYKTKESVEEYIELAKDVNSEHLIQKLKAYLPSLSSLLELGSGPGTDWKILQQDYNVVGSDNSLEFLRHLETKHPNGHFLELDAITLDTNLVFDAIYSNKVLHHLRDGELSRSIQRQTQLLNSRGIVCHSFWKGEGDEVFKEMYVNYHHVENLKKFFDPYFEILLIKEYKEFEDNDSVVLIARLK